MKRIFLLLWLLCATPIFAQSIESQIYPLIIQEFDNPVVVIEDSTSTGLSRLSEFSFERMRSRFPRLQKETFASFVSKNKKKSPAEKNLKSNKEVVFITSEEIQVYFNPKREGDGWAKFYKKYPTAQGILTLSKAGVNKAGTQAVLYYGNQSHWLAGSGYLSFFEKVNGVWTIVDSYMLWIS